MFDVLLRMVPTIDVIVSLIFRPSEKVYKLRPGLQYYKMHPSFVGRILLFAKDGLFVDSALLLP